MVDVATFLGADPNFARQEMMAVLEFEMVLAKHSLPREERRNASKLYNPMRIRDLASLDPNTPWLEYINTILSPDIIQVSFNLIFFFWCVFSICVLQLFFFAQIENFNFFLVANMSN